MLFSYIALPICFIVQCIIFISRMKKWKEKKNWEKIKWCRVDNRNMLMRMRMIKTLELEWELNCVLWRHCLLLLVTAFFPLTLLHLSHFIFSFQTNFNRKFSPYTYHLQLNYIFQTIWAVNEANHLTFHAILQLFI